MSYKVTYFDAQGRGEPIRLIFAAAGVKYADNRIKGETWPALKPTTPWEQLPILEVGDKTLAQTSTICRYLARKFKLTGANEWEASKCDEYVDAVNDMAVQWLKFILEKDATKKAELKQEFVSIAAKYLTKLNTIQYENGGNFIVGKSLTWADIYISYQLVNLEETIDPGLLNGYPHLRKMKDTVFSEPKIKAWLDQRPSK